MVNIDEQFVKRYVLPAMAGLIAAEGGWVDRRLAFAFVAGIFVVYWDPWIIIALLVGYVVGTWLVRRR